MKQHQWLFAIVILAGLLLSPGAQPAHAKVLGASTNESAAWTGSCIDWSDAAQYVGQKVSVCGPVVSTHFASGSNGQPTFLNLGLNYPDAGRMQVVIWGSDRRNFAGSPEYTYQGEYVMVTGTVKLYRGVPEIKVRRPSQITIL
jgi:hypothetical protein